MKIIQITDLHIDEEGGYPFNIDVRKNFIRILSYIKKQQPDHLVVSGDLCYRDPREDITAWVKETLDYCGMSYSVIAGNHDDSTMMAKVFQLNHLLNDGEFYFAKKIKKETVLFLDTAKGSLSKKQSNWLKRQLKNADKDVLIFMHHPPIKAGVAFMDNRHPMQYIEKVQELFFEHASNIHVFCGHYHVEKTVRLKNLSVHITPSCFSKLIIIVLSSKLIIIGLDTGRLFLITRFCLLRFGTLMEAKIEVVFLWKKWWSRFSIGKW